MGLGVSKQKEKHMIKHIELKSKRLLDLKGITCPFTLLRTKRALQELPGEAVLEVILDHYPALKDMPPALAQEGFEVLCIDEVGQGVWKLTIGKQRG